MATMSDRALRRLIRTVLRENVLTGKGFDPRGTVRTQNYLRHSGAPVGISREVLLDDLRVTFGALGFDSHRIIQGALQSRDEGSVEAAVKEVLLGDFSSERGAKEHMSGMTIGQILDPGEIDVLAANIADDILADVVYP